MKNANKMSEYRVNVNITVEIAMYINARSGEDAIAKAEEIMCDHLENDTVIRPNTPDGAIGMDIDEVNCAVSSAIEM